ncbi:CoA transferase [Carboxydochorda subterranea]|uniref:CoA transferase n=1 Tax=Carboxydichorda subterranea TaxID=3109565 RepID=A0ABZ1C0Y4_9FIRM|nr:CoA transferase [Limnochorda sp. L945t]WRP18761.1 CoA transferase [Limnochorda sp. L945t]
MPGPLEGIKVLDLSRVLAGPYCTQILADLGATVWKIEPPWGDETRGWGPPFVQGESAYYLSVNRGKKSVAVNLKEPRGAAIVRELARRADVLVENYKAGDLARFGLGYAAVSAENPRIVYVSITGFGQTGPRGAEPGYDIALQGMTGIMSITGDPAGPPTKVGVAWIDVMTGMMAAVGILAALHERAGSGRGQHLDLALFDVGLAAMANLAQSYLVTGSPPRRIGNAHPQIVPYQVFEASDGWIILAVGNDQQYRRTCEAIGHPELWGDPRFQTNAGRVQHRGELVPRLAEIFRTRPRADWVERLGAAGVPVAPVNDLAEAFTDSQAEARGSVWKLAHPVIGTLAVVASPLQHLSRTPAAPGGHPPLLGEHTREVLQEVLGLTPADVHQLAVSGVVAVSSAPSS